MNITEVNALREVLNKPDAVLSDVSSVCERLLVEVMHQRVLLVQLTLPMHLLSVEILKHHLTGLDEDLAGELVEAAARLRAEVDKASS